VHFYEPIPDTQTLPEELWQGQPYSAGIDFNEPDHLKLLKSFSTRYRLEYDAFAPHATPDPYAFHHDQFMFRSVDAEILYCMIRHLVPRRIIEIGSGFSTLVTAQAMQKNAHEQGVQCALTCIEPFPPAYLKLGVPGLQDFRLLERPLQSVSLEEFQALSEDDILFIDSSHVVKIGSDVLCEFLQILPRLAVGVVVYVHDIFLPAEYQWRWVKELHVFWNEQYLLQAFFMFNRAFQVLWAGSYMHLNHADALQEAFGSYDPTKEWPGSFWMRRIE
jgi:predicted O-methyltransferase YrrM